MPKIVQEQRFVRNREIEHRDPIYGWRDEKHGTKMVEMTKTVPRWMPVGKEEKWELENLPDPPKPDPDFSHEEELLRNRTENYLAQQAAQTSNDPILEPVPRIWSDPGGWLQASLINAGRQKPSIAAALTTSANIWEDIVQPLSTTVADFSTGLFYQVLKNNLEPFGWLASAMNPQAREELPGLVDNIENNFPETTAFRIGRIAGGIVGLVETALLALKGSATIIGGTAACGTGVLCVAGAPAVALGVAELSAAAAVGVASGSAIIEQLATLLVGSGSSSSLNSAYEEARSGGRHSGSYENYRNRSTSEIEKARKSYLDNVRIHENKLLDPVSAVDNWGLLSELEQVGLLKKWRDDLIRNQELADIIRGILSARGQ